MGAVLFLDLPVVPPVAAPADDLAPLVTLAQGGDERALEDLLRASYDHVYPVCRRIVGHPVDAADAAQEALISVARGLARFDGRSRYSTWLYRIAVNAAIDELRRRSRRRVVALTPSLLAGEVAGSSLVERGPEDVVDRLDLEAALMDLPMEFRSAVVLRDVCGMDYAEIAEVLSIPGGTVRSRIARGRSLLAGLMTVEERE